MPDPALDSPMPSAFRLLVVEDDPSIQTLLRAIFRRRGIEVEIAADGEAALACLRRRSWDGLILDLMLPAVNGFEIIRELKARDAALLERTVVLTAASDATLRDFSDGSLVGRLVRKPFEIEGLLRAVSECTGGRLPAAPQP